MKPLHKMTLEELMAAARMLELAEEHLRQRRKKSSQASKLKQEVLQEIQSRS